jgi:F-type H+-transporting ATPase subunit gamma
MADTKTIKTKLKSVGNIKKITRAMEMVARSKMKKSIDRALATRPFAYFGLEFLVNFSYHKSATNFYYKRQSGEKTLIVEMTANRGLCGGYNGNMFRELRKYISSNNLKNVEFISVGKYATHHAKLLGGQMVESFVEFTEDITLGDAEKLTDTIKRKYQTGEYRSVLIAFTNFVSTLTQKPVVYELLPLTSESFKNQLEQDGDQANYIEIANKDVQRDWSLYKIEPNEEEILDVIIPKLVTSQVYQALLDASASEQAARMMAMKNATENAEEIEDDLLLTF